MSDEFVRPPKGVLDTNILIHWSGLDARTLPVDGAITAVTLAELAAAVHADITAEARAGRVDTLQRAESGFDPLPFDAAAARVYGRIAAAVRSIGRSPRSRVADQMIAAIAASQDLPLFTTNARDYQGLDGIVTIVSVPLPLP
ncbi:MAG: type II toxin-antitoxin system VapC family toxin [Microbacterium sp.]